MYTGSFHKRSRKLRKLFFLIDHYLIRHMTHSHTNSSLCSFIGNYTAPTRRFLASSSASSAQACTCACRLNVVTLVPVQAVPSGISLPKVTPNVFNDVHGEVLAEDAGSSLFAYDTGSSSPVSESLSSDDAVVDAAPPVSPPLQVLALFLGASRNESRARGPPPAPSAPAPVSRHNH